MKVIMLRFMRMLLLTFYRQKYCVFITTMCVKALILYISLLLLTSSNYSDLISILLNRKLNGSVSVVQRWIITIWSFVIIHSLTNAVITRTHFYGVEPDTLPAFPQSGNESGGHNQKTDH